MATTLRSARRTAPRKKYTNDPFEGIASLQSDRGSFSDGESGTDQDDGDSDAEEEFTVGAEPSDADDDDDDESVSGLNDPGPADDLASDAGEQSLDDDMSIADEDLLDDEPAPSSRRGRRPGVEIPDQQRIHDRGIRDNLHNRITMPRRHTYFFGPTREDNESVFKAQRQWGHQFCLPSRKKTETRLGGFVHSLSHQNEIKNVESNWRWYSQGGGKQALRQRQVLQPLSQIEALKYFPFDGSGVRSFVMGPIKQRKLYRLQLRQSMVLSEPFRRDSEEGTTKKALPTHYKNGFIINLGARVNCLDWAPNQTGEKQYLAVSTLSERKHDHPFLAAPEAPAFAPQPPSETSIQIWEFCASEKDFIDKDKVPRLNTLLCASMGDVKDLKWCPVPTVASDALGLLGCISTDGALRILDVGKPAVASDTTSVLVAKPAFESKPPDTVYTSLTWLSSSRLAASCANGFVAVWDLSKLSDFSIGNPRPERYIGISTSYIMTIVSCYPTAPNLLIATSMSGHLTMTDLNEPAAASPAGTALSTRNRRLCQSQIVWHDFSHTALHVEDNLTVKAYSMRRWFTTIGTNRTKSNATSLAVSQCHPFVLAGTANGEVVGHNPINRILYGGRQELIQQIWFSHEWRRPSEEERDAAQREGDTSVQAVIGEDGLSNIVDGFKATPVALTGHGTTSWNSVDGVPFNTIYEQKTAVTSLAWNPNIHVGGWAAAGMGDGLLRVEDIAS